MIRASSNIPTTPVTPIAIPTKIAPKGKIKLVVFDLDGVLVDSRELHYEALNRALAEIDPKYVIQREEHLSRYDGLPTTAKLNMLSKEKGLPTNLHNQIWRLKQDKTFEVINDTFQYDNRLRLILSKLKERGLQLFCASNSIYNTIKLMLLRKGILEYFDFIMSCEDVGHPKPAPDIYISCCLRANIPTSQCVILEDSHVGRKAALMSGCHLLPVENPESVTLERILLTIDHINTIQATHSPTESTLHNLTVIVPMAASYQEYVQSGFDYPAPLVEVNGQPMVQMVVENLNVNANYIFIVQKDVAEKFNMKYVLDAITPNCQIVTVDGETEGQAASILLTEELVPKGSPVLISNCNQYIDWDSKKFLELCEAESNDGAVVTFKNTHPRYSYVSFSTTTNIVSDIAEKQPISDNATVGVYFFKKSEEMFKYLHEIIDTKDAVNGFFYLSTAISRAIKGGMKIAAYPCPAMYPLNFPRDLDNFYTALKEKALE